MGQRKKMKYQSEILSTYATPDTHKLGPWGGALLGALGLHCNDKGVPHEGVVQYIGWRELTYI